MKKFLGVLAICICINNLFAQEKPNVVVAPFESIGEITESDSVTITKLFTSQLVMQNKFHVVEHQNLDAVIDELHFQSSDWSSDNNKVQSIGKAVNAQYIVHGQLMKLDSRFFLSATLLKIDGFEVVSASQSEFDNLGNVLSVIPDMVNTMTEKIVPTVEKKYIDPIVGIWQAESYDGILVIEFFENNTLRVHQWDYYDEDSIWWGNKKQSTSGEGYWEYWNSELKLNFKFYNSNFDRFNRTVEYQFDMGNRSLRLKPELKLKGVTKYYQFYKVN